MTQLSQRGFSVSGPLQCPSFNLRKRPRLCGDIAVPYGRGTAKVGSQTEEGEKKREMLRRGTFFLKGEGDKVITTFISPRLFSQLGADRTGTLEN